MSSLGIVSPHLRLREEVACGITRVRPIDFSLPWGSTSRKRPIRGDPLPAAAGRRGDRVTLRFAAMHMSLNGRFCCRSLLQAFLVGDSVAVMRFATGAGDDGAAEARPGAVFLFISSR